MQSRGGAVVSKRFSKHVSKRKKFTTKEDGARLVFETAQITKIGHNERTCLLDEVATLPPTERKELIHVAMVECMPAEGNTKVCQLYTPIGKHCLSLERVSHRYNKKGGYPYHLLQETDCNLIIHIRLTDMKGEAISHFVAWNGKVIIDHPKSSKVNDTTDRTDQEKSNLAFGKLYPTTKFLSWQITSVYALGEQFIPIVPAPHVHYCDETP